MKRRLTSFNCLLGLTFVFSLVADICDAEVLHSWVEPSLNHSFQNGDIVEELFYTYTSKSAQRSEPGGSWSVTGSATASANAHASSPDPGNLTRQWDAHALLRMRRIRRHSVQVKLKISRR